MPRSIAILAGLGLALTACRDQPTTGSSALPPVPDDVARLVAAHNLTGPVAAARHDGGLIVASSGAVYSARAPAPSRSVLNSAQQGNDAPESALFFIAHPGGGRFTFHADSTAGVTWRFFCVDPITGQLFPMNEARVDSTVQVPFELTGGHDNIQHPIDTKPVGTWMPDSGPVTTGVFNQQYHANIASGDEEMRFYYTITDPAAGPGCKDVPESVFLRTGVRVRGLVELVEGTEGSHFQPITSGHFSVFYVTPAAEAATYRVARAYRTAVQQDPTQQPDSLRINAAALIFGGINDIGSAARKWRPPHVTHRVGTDLDLDGSRPSQALLDIIERVGNRLGFNLCVKEASTSTGVLDHVHCYFRRYPSS